MKPRGLIVDFGGVLTTSIVESFRTFCEREGVAWDRLEGVLRDSYVEPDPGSLVALVEMGSIPTEEFERRLAASLSDGTDRPVEARRLVERMLGTVEPEPVMLEAVRRIRGSGAKTALLSNAWSTGQYRVARMRPEDLFDAVVISSEVRLRKPDPEIYLIAARRLALEPSACVFVDDIEQNAEAARGVGMRGIVHREPRETIRELEEAFGVSIGVPD